MCKMRNQLLSLLLVSGAILLINNVAEAQVVFSKRPSWKQEFSSFYRKPLTEWDVFKGKYATEEQYYTDSIRNIYVKNGKLHIKATSDVHDEKVCSSGRISTKGYKSFLYGKLEIRAKIPTGKGIFPAIWMLREDHGNVFPLGEIDIMEYIECFEGKRYHNTVHIVEKELGKKELRHKHYESVEADMTKYHVYSFEWTPNLLVFYLDGKVVNQLKKEDAEFWPFDAPYVLILNVAYGSWGAQCGTDNTIFPVEMLVDWIRYYPLIQK